MIFSLQHTGSLHGPVYMQLCLLALTIRTDQARVWNSNIMLLIEIESTDSQQIYLSPFPPTAPLLSPGTRHVTKPVEVHLWLQL
jgi:hypothetical protein